MKNASARALLPLAALLLPAGGAADGPRVAGPTAITDVAVVVAPGESVSPATILVDRGRIIAVGADVVIPPGAERIRGTGLTAYAGFVDGFARRGLEPSAPSEAEERRLEDDFPSVSDGPQALTVAANRHGIASRSRVEERLDVSGDAFAKSREAGFTAALLAGPQAILGGTASVVQLGDQPVRRSVLNAAVAHTASFEPPGRRAISERGRYPSTAFGVIAQFRQVMSDAAWYRDMTAYVASHPEARLELPLDPDLEALQAVLSGQTRVAWEANTADEIHRALDLAAEWSFQPVIVGGREAYKATDRLKASGVPVVLSLRIPPKPKEYKLEARKLRKAAGDESLYGRNWEERPFQPRSAYELEARLRDERIGCAVGLEQAGVDWCFASVELSDPTTALESVHEMIERGLSADAALRGLTLAPARLWGLERELGRVQAGMRANLTLLTKPLGEKDAAVRYVFVDGRRFEFRPERERGERRGERGESDTPGPSDDDGGAVVDHDHAAAAYSCRTVDVGGCDGAGDDACCAAGGLEPAPTWESQDQEPRRRGRRSRGERDRDREADERSAGSQPATTATSSAEAEPPPGPLDDILLHEPQWAIESDADRDPGLRLGGDVLFTHAYVIPVSAPDLPRASILVRGGKIAAIGTNVAAPAGVTVIDLAGRAVMPGIVDPHSHIALDAVNEASLSVTPEVRCDDVVRHDDVSIYRALVGGTTTIHAMHGSANTIGGQNVILKLKYGRPSSEMIVRDRHRTVKLALGENVKRGGMPPRGEGLRGEGPRDVRRFPGTRMGVETTLRRAFAAARDYAAARAAARSAGPGARPLRRDLRLEALADILSGDIWVHCHSYRADEILRLLSVAEDFGFRVAVLQHVLEGYRIMPEILRHGCAASTFSDWWAYKVEAYDAVPHNAGMLLRHGVCTTINSDSADLIRHLNLEAAKCVKYSGLSPREALSLITLNGARQLGLEQRIGSLEVGKDADLAIFEGHPLGAYSRCVLTLIEGEVYFRHRDFAPQGTHAPVVLAAPAALTAAADPEPPAAPGVVAPPPPPPAASAYAVTGATLHTVSHGVIERGTIVLRDGKIVALGAEVSPPPDATVIEASGRHVFPGLINAATTVGLSEIGAVDVTIDTSEPGTYQPDVRAVSAFNPHSASVEVTRSEGVLSAVVIPMDPAVAGQAGLVDLDGWTMESMLVDPTVGLVVRLPSRPAEPIAERDRSRRRGRRGEAAREEGGSQALDEMARFFRDARRYADATESAAAGSPAAALERDPRFDAMIPYVTGRRPVFFVAGEYKAILEVLLFAAQLELRPVILGGRDAWKAADLLAARHVPVIYDAVFQAPREPECWDANFRALSILSRAGVKFCLATRDASLAKLLGVEAGFAAAHGLSPDDALRAMTLSAAEILGVEDRLGSLDVGKQANLFVATDHPCQATARVTAAFIRGRPVSLDNKHSRAAERFAQRPAPSLPTAPPRLAGPPAQEAAGTH